MHTLAQTTHAVLVAKKSRFVATAARATNADQAMLHVAKHSDAKASHNAWAFQLAGGYYKSNNDGEPGGTAGPPIAAAIAAAELTDVVVLVTRYYGGTKLGTGGLARAYGGAAAAALEAATRVEMVPKTRCVCVFAPADTGTVYSLAGAWVDAGRSSEPGAAESSGGESVLTLRVPSSEVDALAASINRATSGRARILIP